MVEEVGNLYLDIQPHMYLVSIDLGIHVTWQMKSLCWESFGPENGRESNQTWTFSCPTPSQN